MRRSSIPRAPRSTATISAADAVFAGVQAGYNWQVPNTFFVLGVEADVSSIGANGSGTCLASSGFFISANCRTRPDLGGTLTGRAGYAIGPGGHTLIYAKGGLAWLDDRIDVTTNGLYPPQTDDFQWRALGLDCRRRCRAALTPAWSFKVEYDYAEVRRSHDPDAAKLPAGDSGLAVRLHSDAGRHRDHQSESANRQSRSELQDRRGHVFAMGAVAGGLSSARRHRCRGCPGGAIRIRRARLVFVRTLPEGSRRL